MQALRIVEDFEAALRRFRGLNLTFEVREGIIKHSHDYCAAEHPELAEYLLDQRPPLEAQLIDLTDEIAYNTADLDDGYEAKLLRLADIRRQVPRFRPLLPCRRRRSIRMRRQAEVQRGAEAHADRFVTDLIENTRRRVNEAGVQSVGDVRHLPERLVAFSSEADEERRETKQFLYRTLYQSKALMPEKKRAEKVVSEVFSALVARPEALPSSYREKAEEEKLVRVICDYIAGMTDHYIEELRKKLGANVLGVSGDMR